jgi:hypothetical protein
MGNFTTTWHTFTLWRSAISALLDVVFSGLFLIERFDSGLCIVSRWCIRGLDPLAKMLVAGRHAA